MCTPIHRHNEPQSLNSLASFPLSWPVHSLNSLSHTNSINSLTHPVHSFTQFLTSLDSLLTNPTTTMRLAERSCNLITLLTTISMSIPLATATYYVERTYTIGTLATSIACNRHVNIHPSESNARYAKYEY